MTASEKVAHSISEEFILGYSTLDEFEKETFVNGKRITYRDDEKVYDEIFQSGDSWMYDPDSPYDTGRKTHDGTYRLSDKLVDEMARVLRDKIKVTKYDENRYSNVIVPGGEYRIHLKEKLKSLHNEIADIEIIVKVPKSYRPFDTKIRKPLRSHDDIHTPNLPKESEEVAQNMDESEYSDFINSEDGKELKDLINQIIAVSKKLTVSSAKFKDAVNDTSHGSYDRQQNMSSQFFSYLERFKELRRNIRDYLGEEDDGWSNDVIWIGNPDEGQFNVIINEPYKNMFGAI